MLTVVIKGTNGCNLNCDYCSLGTKINVKLCDSNRLFDIFKFSCEECKKRKFKKINFILHGGEPTLIGVDEYRTAMKSLCNLYPSIDINYSIQTNGYKIDKNVISFIKEFNINVGVSIDGSKKIHNIQRKSVNGENTFEQVCKNIDLLLLNQINVSCLMVLTNNSLCEDFDFLHFFEERGIHLKINPLLNYGEVYNHPELSLKPGDYSNYLIKMFEYILENNIQINISPLDSYLLSSITNSKMIECTFNKNCYYNFLCIDYEGDIYPCGKYSDLKEYKIGNIYTYKDNIIESKIMNILHNRRNRYKPKECITCKYIKKCNTGCNAEASLEKNFFSKPQLCYDYIVLFDYFEKKGLELYKQYLINKRKELINREI